MKVLHSPIEEGFVELKVSATADDVKRAFDIASGNFCDQMGIKREAGKTLAQCAEEQHGLKDLDAVVAPSATEALVPLAIDKSGFFPAYVPNVDFATVPRIKRGEPFSFEIKLPLKGDYTLSSYDPVEVEVSPYGDDEEAIEKQIQKMASNFKEFEDIEDVLEIAAGDAALIKVDCTHNGEDVAGVTTEGRTYVAGVGAMPEEFDNNVIGMKPGEVKEFSFVLDEMGPDGAPVKETYNCVVEVKNLQREADPELNDEWVKKNLPQFASAEEWRSAVAEAVVSEHRIQYDNYVRNAVAAELAKRLEGMIPDDVIQATMQEMITNMQVQVSLQGGTWEQFVQQSGGEQQFQMQVMMHTRITLMQCYALDALYAHEKLNATEKDLLDVCAQTDPRNPAQVRNFMEEQGYGFSLRESAQRMCANKWAVEHAKITERAEEN